MIAAVENNSQGIVGIAPAARLYAMRACWPAPRDDSAPLQHADARQGDRCGDRSIDIVNLSLTGPAIRCPARSSKWACAAVVFVGARASEQHTAARFRLESRA